MKQTESGNGHLKRFQTIRQPHFTKHARKRMAQRNISSKDVCTAMHYGQKLHRTGIVFFFLGQNDIPETMQKVLDYLEGTIVLFNPERAEVITVYRNRNGLRNIKRKTKHSLPRHYLKQG